MPPISASSTKVEPMARGSIRLNKPSVPGENGVCGVMNGSRAAAGRLGMSCRPGFFTTEASADMPWATAKPLSSQKAVKATSGSIPR